MVNQQWSPIWFRKTNGAAPIVLICEHAAHVIPEDFGDMGLDDAARLSHAAWDIGAEPVAAEMSRILDAPLLSCGVSRLLYDCNRPPTAADCIPPRSEVFDIPGNRDLSETDVAGRCMLIHDPFHHAATQLIDLQMQRVGGPVSIVTIHSFTPVYHGQPRDTQLGFLFRDRAALSQAALRVERAKGRFRAELNAPYSAKDGVTYSIVRHAEDRGLPTTMSEIRNDLIGSAADAGDMAAHLADTILQATRTGGGT